MFRTLSLAFPTTPTNAESNHQDQGHLHRLNEVRNDFKTSFPNLEIAVHVLYTDTHVPVTLEIRRSLRRQLCSIEKYEKHLTLSSLSGMTMYEDFVD
jgi:hypothetical protein